MKKETGVLLHISSLPSKYGIGSFGEEAYKMVDLLKKSHFIVWQILPLNITSYGDSPYQSPCSFGLNYYFIDLPTLVKKQLLKEKEIKELEVENKDARINYSSLFNNRLPILKLAFSRFNLKDTDFLKFRKENPKYEDFAFFMVLKEKNNFRPWYEWNEKERNYSINLKNEIIKKFENLFLFYIWTQFEFLNEYNLFKEYANKNDIKIMGDAPIYVVYDSLDVYQNPELFELNEYKEPINVAGCPPDFYSKDGQLWGNPLYNWAKHKETHYKWWNDRINSSLKLYDLLRIDHFRGFSAYYSVPFKDKNARNGKWVKGPGFDLFKDKLDLPIIAEDLGQLDEDFYKFKEKTGYPGMKILHQCFDNDDERNEWRPSNYTYNYFSYTSTHDSVTLKEYIDELDEYKKEIFIRVLKDECNKFGIELGDNLTNEEYVEKIIELNIASPAKVAIMPMQDLLKLGKEARMNQPATLSTNNWSWKMSYSDFDKFKKEVTSKLCMLNELYKRIG